MTAETLSLPMLVLHSAAKALALLALPVPNVTSAWSLRGLLLLCMASCAWAGAST